MATPALHNNAALAFENDDLLACVMLELGRASVPSLVSAAGACRRWRKIIQGEDLWRELCCDHFQSITSLVGVMSWKHLCMQLHLRALQPPVSGGLHNFDQYQFLVRFTEGRKVMLDACLSGSDAAHCRADWMTSPDHRNMCWRVPIEVGHTIVNPRMLAELLVDVAGREAGIDGQHSEDTWRLSVAAFCATDQRCKLILESGVSEDWINCYDPRCNEEGQEPVEFGDHHSTRVSLDALQVVGQGGSLRDEGGRPFFVLAAEDEPDDDYYMRPMIHLVALLTPHFKAANDVEWILGLELYCEGCEGDGAGGVTGSYLGGWLQHVHLLRALQESLRVPFRPLDTLPVIQIET